MLLGGIVRGPKRSRQKTTDDDRQLWLFEPLPTAWDDCADLARSVDLSESMALQAVVSEQLRATEAARLLGLPRGWARRELLLRVVLAERYGQSIGTIADACGVNKKLLLAVARRLGLRYRNRRPSSKEIGEALRLVLSSGESIRGASCRSGISRSALHRYVLAKRDRVAAKAGDFEVQRSKQWRCPVHGVINVYPCVACAASAARRKSP